jgi:RND family efflux transporter MFP subunit
VSLGLGLIPGLAGCQPSGAGAPASPAAKSAPPAKVEGAPKEADLATVTLTPEAEKHLGIVTATAQRKPVPRTSTYNGEMMIRPGGLINVTSPLAGTIKPPPDAALPAPGTVVKEGQPLFVLVPILSPDARATLAAQLKNLEGQVKTTQEQSGIAKTNLDRAEKLRKGDLVSAAALVDAKAQYDLAKKQLEAAEGQRDTLARVIAEAEAGGSGVLTIKATASGMIQNVHAQAGQQVAAGAALFEVVGLDPLWVKAPVYVGDMPKLNTNRPADVGGLADVPGASGSRPGKPVPAPPSGDPLAATVNVFYEVANKDGLFRPGEKVAVTLPLRGTDESLTVPKASLYRDYHGGTWVYEQVADHKYARRHVLVDRVVGDVAVVVSGPKPGAKVVTDGAAELFGAEFGGSK